MKTFVKLKNAGYQVLLTSSTQSSKAKVRGVLCDEEGNALKEFNAKTRKAKSKKEIKILAQQIVNEFEDLLKPKAPKPEKKSSGSKEWIDPRLIDALDAVIQSKVLSDKWAKSTMAKYLAKFKKYILPAISPPEEFDRKKKVTLEEQLKESLEKNARKGNQLNARRYAQVYLHAADSIYKNMQVVDGTLPDLELETDSMRVPVKRREQPKHIPLDVQARFEARVIELMYDDPVLARAIAVFHSCGTRNREAASVIYSDIIYNSCYTLLDIATQEIDGERNPTLKTAAAYRKVVLDRWGEYVVQETKDLIGSAEDVKLAPITARKLSKKIKELLIECGLAPEFFKVAALDMEQYPDYGPDGKPITDVTAYILRRNRASIWANYCGLTDSEIDYMLGHARYNNEMDRFDNKDPRAFARIAQKIKSINFSKNFQKCSIATISLENASVELPNNPTIEVENDTNEEIIIEGFFQSCEPGDSVRIIIEGEVKSCKVMSRRHTVRPQEALVGHIEEGD